MGSTRTIRALAHGVAFDAGERDDAGHHLAGLGHASAQLAMLLAAGDGEWRESRITSGEHRMRRRFSRLAMS
jgi:hypothetical protein